MSADPLPTIDPALASTLESFAPATPELLARRTLLRRRDSKYVVPIQRLFGLVRELGSGYAAIVVPSGHVARYRNLYFDTPELRSYHDHRRGRRIRYKVRIRSYPDRGLAFVEVKSRRSDAITDKQRLAAVYGSVRLGEAEHAFLETCCPYASELVPALRVDYQRIGLVGIESDERVTIDLGIELDDLHTHCRTLAEVAIIEIKQPGRAHSPMLGVLRANGFQPRSISKYVVGIAQGGLKRNRFLPALRAVGAYP